MATQIERHHEQRNYIMSIAMTNAIRIAVNKQVGELTRSTGNVLAELTVGRVNSNNELTEESIERLNVNIGAFDDIAQALRDLADEVAAKAKRFRAASEAISEA
jgi:ABC-type transporter Mla subunit MlaD